MICEDCETWLSKKILPHDRGKLFNIMAPVSIDGKILESAWFCSECFHYIYSTYHHLEVVNAIRSDDDAA